MSSTNLLRFLQMEVKALFFLFTSSVRVEVLNVVVLMVVVGFLQHQVPATN